MSNPGFIYLISRSPSRRELLTQLGVPYQMFLLREDPRRGVDIDETRLPGELPEAHVTRLAKAKAAFAWQKLPARGLMRAPALAAHTAVVLGDDMLGKPASPADAAHMLGRLSGQTHHVLSVVAIAHEDCVETALSISEVAFRPLKTDEIDRYIGSGEPFGKAGGYAIDGKAAVFARSIHGSYSGIIGLPLFETAELLRHFGIDILTLRARPRLL